MQSQQRTKHERRLLRAVAVTLMVLALLIIGKSISQNRSNASTGSEPDARNALVVTQRRAVSLEKEQRIHRQGAGRVARGEVASGGVNGQWGLVILENLRGQPESGDEAYLARLGPEGGLMKVEAIEEGKAVLSFDALDMKELLEGDRIETMPPRLPNK